MPLPPSRRATARCSTLSWKTDLEEEGVQTGCLGTVRALPITEEVVGAGSVAVAIAPESSYRRDVPK